MSADADVLLSLARLTHRVREDTGFFCEACGYLFPCAALRLTDELKKAQARLAAVLALHERQDWEGVQCCGICGLAQVNRQGYCETAVAAGLDGAP